MTIFLFFYFIDAVVLILIFQIFFNVLSLIVKIFKIIFINKCNTKFKVKKLLFLFFTVELFFEDKEISSSSSSTLSIYSIILGFKLALSVSISGY